MNRYTDLSTLMTDVTDTQKPFVIVGGGIAGIYAATLLQDVCPHQKVILIEQSSRLGGLLASKQFHGQWFDFGTHVPRQTGLAHIDELLFDDMQSKGFSAFNNSNAANISKDNYLYTRSPNPFLATPDNHNVQDQLDEINQAAQSEPPVSDNLETQLIQMYGKSLTDEFFRPCMQKRFGTDLRALAPNSHQLIGLSRLVLGDAELMKQLKQHPAYDKVLAFADQTEGMSQLNHYYPYDGEGVGKWVDGLVDKLDPANVSIFTQAQVANISVNEGIVTNLSFIDENRHEHTIECAHVFWCGPVFPLLKLSGSEYRPAYRPVIRQTYLYHFAFEQAPLIDSNYVNINDPSFSSFRVTLYSNLCKTDTDTHRVTVEVIADATLDEIPDINAIHQELIKMQLIGADNPLQFSVKDCVKAGFPVLTVEFMQELERQSAAALSHMGNLALLGKANGKSFFMQDVLVNTHEQVCALVEGE